MLVAGGFVLPRAAAGPRSDANVYALPPTHGVKRPRPRLGVLMLMLVLELVVEAISRCCRGAAGTGTGTGTGGCRASVASSVVPDLQQRRHFARRLGGVAAKVEVLCDQTGIGAGRTARRIRLELSPPMAADADADAGAGAAAFLVAAAARQPGGKRMLRMALPPGKDGRRLVFPLSRQRGGVPRSPPTPTTTFAATVATATVVPR